MMVPDVEQAKRRLQDILRKAQKLEIPPQEVISTRTAQKLLARTRNALAWTIWITLFVLLLSGVVYARWPTRQEVETIRTVLVRTDHLSAEKPGDATKSNTKSVRLETVTDLYQRARRQKNVNGTALCSGATSGDFSERVAALLHSSSTQDDC